MKIKKQMICILLGTAGFLAAGIRTGQSGDELRELKRPPWGQGSVGYEILVEGLEDHPVTLELQVEEREFTEQQADLIFDQIVESLPDQILGENQSLNEVKSNLNLLSFEAEYGVRLSWYSEDPEVMDSFGQITGRNLPDEGRPSSLTVILSQGKIKREYRIPIRVYPPELTKEEAAAAKFNELLCSLEQQGRTQEILKLPQYYEGKELHYRIPEDTGRSVLLVLGVLLAVLCTAKEKMDEREAEKQRRSQLLLDYSELVSKLMIFIGAGMTVPGAWEQVALSYEKMRKEGRSERRYVYEEVCTSYYQMKSGVSEGKAYRDFGRRTGLNCYLKLAGLLEQNRKTGIKNLKLLLDAEMEAAFEQRKNLAKKLGEEAGTKLLLPLFLMLGVVMVMIMVPAFLVMY